MIYYGEIIADDLRHHQKYPNTMNTNGMNRIKTRSVLIFMWICMRVPNTAKLNGFYFRKAYFIFNGRWP